MSPSDKKYLLPSIPACGIIIVGVMCHVTIVTIIIILIEQLECFQQFRCQGNSLDSDEVSDGSTLLLRTLLRQRKNSELEHHTKNLPPSPEEGLEDRQGGHCSSYRRGGALPSPSHSAKPVLKKQWSQNHQKKEADFGQSCVIPHNHFHLRATARQNLQLAQP